MESSIPTHAAAKVERLETTSCSNSRKVSAVKHSINADAFNVLLNLPVGTFLGDCFYFYTSKVSKVGILSFRIYCYSNTTVAQKMY